MVSHVYVDFFGTLVDYDASVHPDGANGPWEFCRHGGVSRAQSDAAWDRAWADLEADAERTGRESSMHAVASRFAAAVGVTGDLDALVERYLDAWSAGVLVDPDALACLTDLACDHRVAVVSNTHSPVLVPALMRRFGLADVVPDVFTSVEIGWRKPRREIFAHVLGADGVAASSAVFVGDNPVADVAGPLAAGMAAFRIVRTGSGIDGVTLAELPGVVRALG